MSSAQRTAVQPASTAALRSENAALQEQVESLKTQLDWFKRQLFGSKSEKRLVIDPAVQADLLAGLNAVNPKAPLPASETITYERRKSRGDKTVTDSGLRFDDSVPMETIELPSPAIDLLTPIFHDQFGNILQSRVLAMDETPIKAGRKHKGKLRQAYFWPIYGEADEIAFSYSRSRASAHVREVLGETFKGTLVDPLALGAA